jgi:hypothetical protein
MKTMFNYWQCTEWRHYSHNVLKFVEIMWSINQWTAWTDLADRIFFFLH